jgi:hypothetical protein
LDSDREIVVIRGPTVRPDLIGDVAPPQVTDDSNRWTGMYSIRIELRSRGRAPLMLASRLAGGDEAHLGFEVLDMIVEPGEIVTATVEGVGIVLWHVVLLKSSTLTWLPFDWNLPAARRPQDWNRVSAKLQRRAVDGKLTVEVADLVVMKPHRPYTLFEQVDGGVGIQGGEAIPRRGRAAGGT